jgi:hypothetical protein
MRTPAGAGSIFRSSSSALLLALVASGCERGPAPGDTAKLQAACERQVDAWVGRQQGFGATYDVQPYYDARSGRCLAHVQGGDAPASRFESVVDVQRDRVIAGCAAAREAVGDTPCQVDGKPASGSAGRLTIDRMIGR